MIEWLVVVVAVVVGGGGVVGVGVVVFIRNFWDYYTAQTYRY